MAGGIVANLFRASGVGQRKLYVGTGSITGTGSIVTGLSDIDPGAQVTSQNSATTIPTNLPTISGITGGTVSVVVVALASAANTISAVACSVGLLCTGY